MPARDIEWPPELHPSTAPVFIHNEIYIPSEPEVVWQHLIRASHWHEHYAHCRGLRFADDGGPDLAEDTEFSWRTFGVRVTTNVTEFKPPHRLAWRGEGPGGHAYHGWVIDPVADGCRVVTQEAQSGLFPSLLRIPVRRVLRRAHRLWLEGLAAVVMNDDPLPASRASQSD